MPCQTDPKPIEVQDPSNGVWCFEVNCADAPGGTGWIRVDAFDA